MKKTINYILFIIFIIFAVLQLNDPDGTIWFTVYGIVAALFLVENFKVIPKSILVLVIMGLLIYAAFHLTLFIDYLQTEHKEDIFGKMVYDKPYLEGSREFLGLLIAASAVIYLIKSKPKT